jgi:hypothetical protein
MSGHGAQTNCSHPDCGWLSRPGTPSFQEIFNPGRMASNTFASSAAGSVTARKWIGLRGCGRIPCSPAMLLCGQRHEPPVCASGRTSGPSHRRTGSVTTCTARHGWSTFFSKGCCTCSIGFRPRDTFRDTSTPVPSRQGSNEHGPTHYPEARGAINQFVKTKPCYAKGTGVSRLSLT